MADVRVELPELLSLKEWTHGEEAMLLFYTAESRGLETLDIGDLKALYEEARARPGNLHRDVAVLDDHGVLMKSEGGLALTSGKRWRLSQRGFLATEKLLAEAGLLTTVPERSAVEPLRRVSAHLRTQASSVSNRELKMFVEEALRCLDPSIAALRAAVVLGWAGGIARLKQRVWSFGAPAVNAVITRQSWKYRINLEQDLDDLKESQLLAVAHELGLFDKAALKVLAANLDMRNACAHPTDVSPGVHKVEAFLEEVIDLLYR